MISNELMELFYIAIGFLIFILAILVFVYYRMKKAEENPVEKKEEVKTESKEVSNTKSKTKTYTIGSVFDFMEFDKIEDNMIIQRKGNKFSMIVECQGINFDLMSEEEQVAVEEGFIQFLNTLQSKIQLYIQTRTINLEESINNYKEKLAEIEKDFNRQQIKYKQMAVQGAPDNELRREYYELVKKQNLYEYSKDIISNTQRMSFNKNMLTKKYYVILPYYTAEIENSNLDKEEIKDRAFSELYTRCQSVIRALAVSEVQARILSSLEIADLLYVAYNRDDSEIYGIDKAIRANYDELYSTAPDYMEKKMQILNQEVQRRAEQMANEQVLQAKSELERRYEDKKKNVEDIVANLAQLIISQNETAIGQDIAEKAKENIEKQKKGGSSNNEEENNRAGNVQWLFK